MVSKKKSLDSGPAGTGHSLKALKKKLTPKQRELIDYFWDHFKENGTWPLTRVVHSKMGKTDVQGELRKISGDIVFEGENWNSGNYYELSVIGALLTKNGEAYRLLLTSYFEFLRDQFLAAPEKKQFESKEIAEVLQLSTEQCQLLGNLLSLYLMIYGSGSRSAESWSVSVPAEVEDFPRHGSLESEWEKLLFRRFNSERPALLEDAREYARMRSQEEVLDRTPAPPQVSHSAIDVLKRRYQVFVSSTYEDLKEERQHVMQALLETKCVPMGMELFPAASESQWQLIKRLIDECDYYIVVVAGRYGSVHHSGLGYTEMEFDYARASGKSIFGFYHANPDELPGTKLEKDDKNRLKLKQFSDKITQTICRPWKSPAELGSAVKSAIINALEFDPKPGWVRADALQSSDTFKRMSQRVADLEQKLEKQKNTANPKPASGAELLEVPMAIKYAYQDCEETDLYGDTKIVSKPTKKIQSAIKIKWDELYICWGYALRIGNTLHGLMDALYKWLTPRVNALVDQALEEQGRSYTYEITESVMEAAAKTLVARKLVKQCAGNYGSWENPIWRFTPKGLQYLAELEAIKSSSNT